MILKVKENKVIELANVSVQSNWDEVEETSPAYIQNRPTHALSLIDISSGIPQSSDINVINQYAETNISNQEEYSPTKNEELIYYVRKWRGLADENI